MGRWRPPAPSASAYITPAGFEALQKELDEQWRRRRDVVKALAAAAAEGDRSENAEYIYRKKELGGIDRRIHYLQKRLPELNIVRATPATDTVYFGAVVELRDTADELLTYRIVGPDEADTSSGAISMDSPLAKALLGKQAGDEVLVATAEKTSALHIVSIRYADT